MQLYHSIHAKGENVDDVLREAESKDLDKEELDQNDAMETELDAPLKDSTIDPDKQAEVRQALADYTFIYSPRIG